MDLRLRMEHEPILLCFLSHYSGFFFTLFCSSTGQSEYLSLQPSLGQLQLLNSKDAVQAKQDSEGN